MRVAVKRIGGSHPGLRFELELPESSSETGTDQVSPGLAELKILIAKKTEIPEWAQRVFYQGRYLHGEGSLSEKGIPAEGAVLLLATSAYYKEPAAAQPTTAVATASGLEAGSSSAATPSTGAFSAALFHRVVHPSPDAPLDAADGDAVPSEFSSDAAGSSPLQPSSSAPLASSSDGAASTSSANAVADSSGPCEDLSKLSVAELKQRLRDRGLSFEGCAEKTDLLDLLRNAPPPRPEPKRPPPQPKRPPPTLPMTSSSAAELSFGMPGMGPAPGFVSVGMGPFATGGMLAPGAANLGMFLQQLGPAMDNAMNQALSEVPVQPARGDIGPAPEPPHHPPDNDAASQPAPTAQPGMVQPQMMQGQQTPGGPQITMSFPAGAPPAQAMSAMMQQLGPQIQNVLGPFAQMFGEQNAPPQTMAATQTQTETEPRGTPTQPQELQ